jgi:hypothetical protein
MPPGREPVTTTPWYRTSAATSAAGVLGLAVIAALVYAVVTMSSEWSAPQNDSVLPPGPYVPEAPHVAGTSKSTSTSTSYPQVHLSTTEIGGPSDTTTSGTPTTTSDQAEIPPAERTAPTFPGTFPTRVTNPPGARTSTGPRLNQTRSASP